MQRRGILILFVLVLGTQVLAKGRGGGFIQNSRVTANTWYVRGQTFLTAVVFSCSILSCGVPDLYLFRERPERKAERVVDALAEAQLSIAGSGDIVTTHVHVVPLYGGRELLAEVVSSRDDMLTVRGYAAHDDWNVLSEEPIGYLIDDHPYVGREVRLHSDQAGISYLRGRIISVYTDGFLAVFVRDKVGFDGKVEKLERSFPHRIVLMHEAQWQGREVGEKLPSPPD